MPSAGRSGPLLEVEDVSVYFGRSRAAASGLAAALAGVSLAIQSGVSVGVVGESGSGKTTLLRVLAGLVRPQRGVVRHDGRALDIRHRDSARAFRADVQLVFQDPAGSLDPRQKVWELVSEPAWALTGIRSRERHALTESLLARLGLPTEYADRRPHQLSGGERQRVALARALSSHPKVILLDEPVASLDASRRGQVINLLNDLGREDGVTFVVVSHDIVPVALLTDTMVAMYRAGLSRRVRHATSCATPLIRTRGSSLNQLETRFTVRALMMKFGKRSQAAARIQRDAQSTERRCVTFLRP
jgi:peptide/nickel transport system ATP-binding protein